MLESKYYELKLRKELLYYETQQNLADDLGVNSGLVCRVLGGKASPTVWKAMVKHGVCKSYKPTRRRFACDVPDWMTDNEADEYRRQLRYQAGIISSAIAAARSEP